MAKLIRIWKKFLKSGSAVSAVDADTMAKKRIPKMSKRQLREKVKALEKQLNLERKDKQECIMDQAKNTEIQKKLRLENKSQKALIAEAEKKIQKNVETIEQLESEKAGLTNQVESLQKSMKTMGKVLANTHRECDELTDDCKQEREVLSSLQEENANLKETLMQKEESLKDLEDCLAEEKEKHQKTADTVALLKSEKSGLTSQVERLQEKMHAIGEQLVETQHKCDELTDDCKQEREAHGSLQVENVKLKETLMQKEELLKDSLAEEKEKHQKTVETIALLESSLTSQVNRLQKRLHSIHKQLADANNKCDVLRDECQLERDVRSSLQEENDKLKETLMQKEESLKDLKNQKSSMALCVVKMRQKIQRKMAQLERNEEVINELTDTCEQERQKCNSLQAENDELKEILRQKKEPLKAKRSVPKKPTPASSRVQPYVQAIHKPQTSLPKRKM